MISSTWARTASSEISSEASACAASAVALVDQPEQDVLGPDVVVVEEPRLFLREYDDSAGPVGEALEHAKRVGPGRRRFPAPGLPTMPGHDRSRFRHDFVR